MPLPDDKTLDALRELLASAEAKRKVIVKGLGEAKDSLLEGQVRLLKESIEQLGKERAQLVELLKGVRPEVAAEARERVERIDAALVDFRHWLEKLPSPPSGGIFVGMVDSVKKFFRG